MRDNSLIDVLISGTNPEIDGANHLINDIHGLSVTTTSPSSETVFNLSLICSIANLASPITFLTFLISCTSNAYAFDVVRFLFFVQQQFFGKHDHGYVVIFAVSHQVW